MVTLGYKLMSEEHGPVALLRAEGDLRGAGAAREGRGKAGGVLNEVLSAKD
jgi:hypothetical protein